jgi:ABC-type branched-subunit amino acid transport system ATPase component/predicted MFS family arabinose efflux permease
VSEHAHDGSGDAADLAAVVLEQEAIRQADAAAPTRTVLPDDLLPGVGSEPMGLRAALSDGGVALLTVLSLIVVVEWFDRTALAVLAPDIQSSLGVSDGVIGVIGGAFGILFVLGALPFGNLADRVPRTKVASIATAVWSVVVFATGLVTSAVWLFVARVASGLAQSNSLPVHNSLLADGYPVQARGRVFGLYNLATPIGLVLAPVAVGGMASLVGGNDGWRWAFFATAIPALVLAVVVGFVREPKRGAHEQELVLGETLGEQPDELPIPMGTAFARLQKIRTFYVLLVGVGALGFALFSIPLFFNLFLEHEYGLGAFDRGLVNAATYVPALVVIPIVAMSNDRLFRVSPPRSLVLAGGLIAVFGVILVAGLYMPGLVGLIIVFGIGTALSQAAFAVLTPVVASVLPFRLRSQGYAMFGVYIFLFGAFFGSVLAGVLSDSLGERLALTILVIPSTVIGGAIIATGARHVREDISLVVEELLEERGEQARLAATGATAPMLQIRNLDASYGTVQVLFDVALDVHRGEVLALLGTNGAGKSTLLRVVSGLLVPHRGVVRLEGRTITYADPVTRVDLGIVQVPGGKATFPSLTVRENLKAAAHSVERRSVRARVDRAFDAFPVLREMADRPAAAMSGGQQQMLALAKALVLEPRVLLIDELSLGLAPVVVQELLGVVEHLKAEGMTMVIVEQSLNVALELADRAVFMEKGEVRFEGPAHELRDRHDLVRAVFLGADGG